MTPRVRTTLVAVFVGVLALVAAPVKAQRPPKPASLTVYLSGNSADAPNQPVNGPAVLVMGGGSEADAAFINRAYPVINGGDIAVIRVSGSNGYQSYLYSTLVPSGPLKPDSVETMIVDSLAKANDPYVKWVIETAEMVWIAGGDQSDYLNYWKGTAVEDAVRTVYNRGGVVGGTSAGAMVCSQFIYDPDSVTAITSAQAVANPYHPSMMLDTDFLNTTLTREMVFDTHFYQRDRMGRLLAMMGRLRQDGVTPTVIGVGLGERTAMFIGADRVGRVDVEPTILATDAVFVILEDAATMRTRVAPGQSLIYKDLVRHRLVNGDSFDFNTLTPSGGATRRLTVDGGISPNPYSPTDPYAVPVTVGAWSAE
jgi:cyanophycinase